MPVWPSRNSYYEMIDRSTDGETAVPEADNGQSGPAFVALANLNHVCPICSNHYERADYLKRHLASRKGHSIDSPQYTD